MRFSSSHNEGEIEWLHQLLTTLSRGGSVGVLVRSKVMGAWLRKATVLRRRARGEPPELKPRPPPQAYEPKFPHGNARRPRVIDTMLSLEEDD